MALEKLTTLVSYADDRGDAESGKPVGSAVNVSNTYSPSACPIWPSWEPPSISQTDLETE